MSPEEEIWSEMGFRTRINNTLNVPEQPVLVMVTTRGSRLIATRKNVYSCWRKEVGNDKSWPSKSEEMDTEELNGDEGTEWINEEGDKEICSGLNEELSEMEEDLEGMEFDGMEGYGSAIVKYPGEIGNV